MISIPEFYNIFGNAGVAAIVMFGTVVSAFIGITVLVRLVEMFVSFLYDMFSSDSGAAEERAYNSYLKTHEGYIDYVHDMMEYNDMTEEQAIDAYWARRDGKES